MLHVFFNAVIKVKLTFCTDQHAQPRPVNNCYLSQVADEQLLAHLILVILERSSLLLNIPSYSKDIHRFSHMHVGQTRSSAAFQSCLLTFSTPPCFCRVFSCHLLNLCKLHPSLVVDQSHELLEFAGTTTNVYNKEEIYTHVVMKLWPMLTGGYFE